MRAGAEGQQPPGIVPADVELLAVRRVAVGPLRADGHDRAGREAHAAVLDVGHRDPGGERGDRLEPQHLVDRPGHPGGIGRQRGPLARMSGEQAQRVRQLGLGGVHAARNHIQHQVDALGVGQLRTFVLGRQQRTDQVSARVVATLLEQGLDVVVQLADGLLDPGRLIRQGFDVELPLHPAGPLVQPRRVLRRRAEHGRDGQRRVRLGERGHELAARGPAEAVPQAGQEAAHGRPPAVRGPGRERRADQGPQPAVLLPGLVEDVDVDLLAQPAAGDAEQIGDLPPGEGRVPGTQEELAGLPVQHHEGERGPGQPALFPGRGQPLVVHLAHQVRRGVVEHRQVKVVHH